MTKPLIEANKHGFILIKGDLPVCFAELEDGKEIHSCEQNENHIEDHRCLCGATWKK